MSFTLNYTGDEINAVLARANNGGEIDDELALKAPLASPALTGTPTAPTQPEEDSSTKIATTEYADRAADAAGAAAEAAAKEYTDEATSALYITDTASGSIASFSDGADGIPMRSVKAQIEPVQDLHGYENPWPPGGGKNLINPALSPAGNRRVGYVTYENGDNEVTITTTSDTNYMCLGLYYSLKAGTYTIKYKATSSDDFVPTLTIYRDGSTVVATTIRPDTERTFTISEDITVEVRLFASTLDNGAANRVVRFYQMQLESGSSATEWASYSNICPIEGWTGAEPVRTGKNLVGLNSSPNGAISYVNTTASEHSDNSVTLTSNGSAYAHMRLYYRIPAGTYTIKYQAEVLTSGISPTVTVYNMQNQVVVNSTPANTARTFTFSEEIAVHIDFFVTQATAQAGTARFYDFQLEKSSFATDYESYVGQTFPVTWQSEAGEVFGGTIELVSGKLAVTHRAYVISESTPIVFTPSAEYGARGRVNLEYLPQVTDGTRIYAISEIAESVSYDDRVARPDTWRVYGEMNNWAVSLRAPASANIQTAEELLAPFIGTKLVYPRAEPVIYQLTPQQITSLLGANNVWSDTGDTEVTYVADPKMYIAKITGGGTLTLGGASPLSANRPVAISEEDLEQAGEVSDAVEAAVETVLPAESGETEEGAQE